MNNELSVVQRVAAVHHASPAHATRVIIVEGQALFAKALAHMLTREAALDVIGDCETLSETFIRASRPDLMLIDIDGTNIDIEETIRMSRAIVPNVKVCTLSMHLRPEVMQRCLSAGVDGYLIKDATPNEFVRAIKSVAAGEVHVDSRVAGSLLRRRSSGNQRTDPCDLSNRESEVLRLIVAGMTNKEIAHELLLSEKTVKNHVSRIFSKFNCTARTQAAVYAIRSGLA